MLPTLGTTNRVFDNHFDTLLQWAFPLAGEPASRAMPIDAYETDIDYRFKIDVPGIKQEDINIQVQNRLLTVESNSEMSSLLCR